MGLDWAHVPSEFLLPALRLLPPEDACRAAAVSRKWRSVAIDDLIWKRHCHNIFTWFKDQPKAFCTFFDEFVFFKNRLPKRIASIIDDYDYPLKLVIFSPNGKLMAVTGEPAYICIYDSFSRELLDERCMQTALKWSRIESVQFSPDSQKILLSGVRPNYSGAEVGELCVYQIIENEVHFLCRTPCSPVSFHNCWFDSDYLLISECYPLHIRSPVASSISQLYLFSLPAHRNAPSGFFPLLRFLNRHEPVRWPLVAATASPRFRRVVQLSQQAKQENKSLGEKLAELELNGTIHLDGDLTELREVLDKEQQCFRCYLKHQLTSEEYGTEKPMECNCMCHQVINRLLIFVIDDDEEKIGFKLISNEILHDALNDRRFKVKENEEEETDSWQFITRRVDEVDHMIPMGGIILNMKMSTDQRQLVVTVDMGSLGIRLRSIDLDKMIVDQFGIHWRTAAEGQSTADIGSNIIVGSRNGSMETWSRYHLGLPIGEVDNPGPPATALAIHPIDEYVVTIRDQTLYIWE